MSAQKIDGITGHRPAAAVRIRGGSGLGDSVYLRPLVDHLMRAGRSVTVLSFFPDLFMGSGANVEPFNKSQITVLGHYAGRRANQTTNQWQDVLYSAGAPADLPLRFAWKQRNHELVARVRTKAAGRPIVIVHGGRAPFGRTDGVGLEILPRREGFAAVLGELQDCFTVRVGKGNSIYPVPASLDLSDQTSVSDLIDLFMICDGVVTQCGWPIPLAECFDKPVLGIWSARGLVSTQPIVALVTPAKVLCKPTSGYVVDDWPAARITEAASTFIRV